jgi:NADH-quinone oxidoreductase subunit L
MLWGITGHLDFDGMKVWAEQGGLSTVTTCTLVMAILFTFCGAAGKSAQMPLHVWLPDAMEGPTPVSALIHAATMVAAGVYMLVRLQLSIGVEAFHNDAGHVISWIGGITSLCAALMATQQNDIKRILAYSTLSQLGYMIMVVGLGHGEAGMFHLFTHAWFKALLFLGSGAIIYACHHEQDIWKMGGLLRKMPVTGLTFAIGTLALMAFPFTSGFWSKEEILGAALEENPILFWIAVGVAFLTTFYMTRAFVVTFLGKPRSESADHAHEVGPLMLAPLGILAVMALVSGWSRVNGPLHAMAPPHTEHPHIVLFASLGTLILGFALGFVTYWGKERDPISIPLFRDRFRIDAFYDNVVVRYFQDALAGIVNFFDEFLINGVIVGGTTRLAEGFGGIFRRIQSGNLQAYAFIFGIGVIVVIYFTAF